MFSIISIYLNLSFCIDSKKGLNFSDETIRDLKILEKIGGGVKVGSSVAIGILELKTNDRIRLVGVIAQDAGVKFEVHGDRGDFCRCVGDHAQFPANFIAILIIKDAIFD